MTTITIDRATVEQALEALELGHDTAKAEADRYHVAMAGYKPQRHAQMDAEVQQIAAAITAMRAALAQQTAPDHETRAELAEQQVVQLAEERDHYRNLWQKAQQAEPVEPVAWSGYDLDGMVEALSRVVEAHYQRANPFQNPIDMDAQMALRVLRGFIPAMKAYTAPPQRKPLTEEMEARCPYAKANPTLRGAFFDGWLNSERAHGIKE